MILYEDGYFKLEYEAETDLLYATCPDIRSDELLYIYKVFSILITNLSQHKIKRFLMDSRQNELDASREEFLGVLSVLTNDLTKTGVQKIGRLASHDSLRENMIAALVQEKHTELPFELRSFTNYDAAVKWLSE